MLDLVAIIFRYYYYKYDLLKIFLRDRVCVVSSFASIVYFVWRVRKESEIINLVLNVKSLVTDALGRDIRRRYSYEFS